MSTSAPVDGKWHTVRPGETVKRLAWRAGFRRWETVWDAPENEALAKRRASPDVLQPGDSLFIPARESKIEEGDTGRRHIFRTVARPVERLVILLEDGDGKPVANTPYALEVGDETRQRVTSGEGRIDEEIPMDTRRAVLRYLEREWTLRIGHLDPVADSDTAPDLTGAISRLRNLAHGLDDGCPVDEAGARAAMASFTRREQRTCDPELTTPRRRELRAKHRV